MKRIEGAVLPSMHEDHAKKLRRAVGCEDDEDAEKADGTEVVDGTDRSDAAVNETATVVLSVRDAKGLEFPHVMIVDFLRFLPRE
jgi:superfamily I DNA/RNA helicase